MAGMPDAPTPFFWVEDVGKITNNLYFFLFFMKCLLNYFFWLKRSPPLKLELLTSEFTEKEEKPMPKPELPIMNH